MKDSKYKIVVVILLVVIVCLGGYIVYDAINDKNSQTTDNEVNENNNNGQANNIVNYDMKKAEELVAQYYFWEKGWLNGFVDFASDRDKFYVAFRNVQKNEITCSKAKADIPNITCSNSEKIYVIDYDKVNNKYQKLFGSEQIIPKKDINSLVDSHYYYDGANERFIATPAYIGGASGTHNTYVVKTAEVKNNQLIVEVGYAVGGEGMDIELQNGTAPASEFDSLDKKDEFLSKYKDQLKIKTFTFVLDNGNYVLKNIEG